VANDGVTVLVQDVGVLKEGLDIDEAVVIYFEKEPDGVDWGRFKKGRDKLEHEHGLQGQVVVRVHKILLKKVKNVKVVLLL
jgi:hypothetical protein